MSMVRTKFAIRPITDRAFLEELLRLRWSGGALMVVPAAGGEGTAQIEFVDTVTAKTYTLAVVRGALVLSKA